MSKLGDLIVRLRLQYEDYKKGLKKVDAETKTFAGTLGKIKGVGLAVFGAISVGAATFAKEFASHTNTIGDMWSHTMSAIQASYHSVIADISTYKPDFSSFRNFFKNEWDWIKSTLFNAKEAGNAAVEMSKAFDAEFELIHSVKLQKQQIQQELNELYIKMRNTTLSPTERKAAAEQYKALLQPIADAEISVYSDMVQKAIKAWQAGNALDREYSVAEVTEFFSKIGTEYEKMQKKFPDLMRVYEERKGDAQNLIIFDTIAKLQQAANQMSDIDKLLSRSGLSINKELASRFDIGSLSAEDYAHKVFSEMAQDIQADIRALNVEMAELGNIDIDLSDLDNEIDAFLDKWADSVYEVSALNKMLEDSIIQATTGGMQAFTDMLMGIEGADASDILAALLQPFANTATQLGSLLLAEGIGIKAFKESLKSLNPTVAIAAGTALIALGAALGSAIKSLGGSGSSASASNGGYNSSGASSSNYAPELTIKIQGKLRGSDIVMSEENTKDKWSR